VKSNIEATVQAGINGVYIMGSELTGFTMSLWTARKLRDEMFARASARRDSIDVEKREFMGLPIHIDDTMEKGAVTCNSDGVNIQIVRRVYAQS